MTKSSLISQNFKVVACALTLISSHVVFAIEDTSKCESITKHVVKSAVGAKDISNIESLVTWRASCAEKPPVGEGKVTVLCDGDLNSKNGKVVRIFFWQKQRDDGQMAVGYHLCRSE